MSWPRKCQTALLLLAVAPCAFPTPLRAADDVAAVVAEVDNLWFGARSTADVAMTVKSEHYERVLRLTYWVDGKEHTLIRIVSPAKEKGTSTLKNGEDVYNFLPKIGRTVKISAALRSGSWMGSHFSNDDLLRGSRFADDYESKLLVKRGEGAAEQWTIELKPKPSAAVPWSKVVMELDRTTKIPSRQTFLDEKDAPLRTITFAEIQDLGGRKAPSRVRVVPADRPAEYTELHYERIDRTVTMQADFFSLSRLQNP